MKTIGVLTMPLVPVSVVTVVRGVLSFVLSAISLMCLSWVSLIALWMFLHKEGLDWLSVWAKCEQRWLTRALTVVAFDSRCMPVVARATFFFFIGLISMLYFLLPAKGLLSYASALRTSLTTSLTSSLPVSVCVAIPYAPTSTVSMIRPIASSAMVLGMIWGRIVSTSMAIEKARVEEIGIC